MNNCEQILTNTEDSQDVDGAYSKLLLAETGSEKIWRQKVEDDGEMELAAKTRKLERLEEQYYYRRIINAVYFKQLKSLILSGKYSG